MEEGIEEFKIEILELLEAAEAALLQFDQLPENESAPNLYDEVFRSYHNIKGGAGMMEWTELQHHVHQLENVLMNSKETSSIPKDLIGWFLKGNDVTKSIMNREPYEFEYDISSAKKPSSEKLPQEFYEEVAEGLERISEALLSIETDKGDAVILDALYRDIHSIKGAVQLFGLTEASGLAHAMENSLESIRGRESFEMDKAHVSTLLLCIDLMNQTVQRAGEQDILKEVNFMASLLANFSETKVENVTVP